MLLTEIDKMFFFENYLTIRKNLSDKFMAKDTIFNKKKLSLSF